MSTKGKSLRMKLEKDTRRRESDDKTEQRGEGPSKSLTPILVKLHLNC